MKFTQYYAQILVETGQPHLDLDQHRRLFNIISLENRIDELDKMQCLLNEDKRREHFERSESLKKKLRQLTNHSVPHLVFAEMFEKSEQP